MTTMLALDALTHIQPHVRLQIVEFVDRTEMDGLDGIPQVYDRDESTGHRPCRTLIDWCRDFSPSLPVHISRLRGTGEISPKMS